MISDPYVLNVGGPVWAMAWCPTPLGESAQQYIAVYCHRSVAQCHRLGKPDSQPSLIQIWDCGITNEHGKRGKR